MAVDNNETKESIGKGEGAKPDPAKTTPSKTEPAKTTPAKADAGAKPAEKSADKPADKDPKAQKAPENGSNNGNNGNNGNNDGDDDDGDDEQDGKDGKDGKKGKKGKKKNDEYKPRGFFWRVFAISLSFFLGIFAALGGIAGAAVVLLNGPAEGVLSTLGITPTEYLKEDYLQKSIFEIYDSVIADINAIGSPDRLTLNTFTKYSPLIDDYINEVIAPATTAFGINLDFEQLKEQKLTELGSYAKDVVLPQIELGSLLGLNENVTLEGINENAMMYALSYGSYGRDYTISDGKIQMAEGRKAATIIDLAPTLASTPPTNEDGTPKTAMDFFGSLELGSFLGLDIRLPSEAEDDNAMFYALCYGSEGTDFHFDDQGILHMDNGKTGTLLNDLIHNANEKLDGLSLGALLGLESAESLAERESNALMYSICYGTEGVDYKVENNKIVRLQGGAEPTTIGKLTSDSNSVVNSLQLGEMLGLNTKEKVADRENNSMMYALCYGEEGENGDYTVDPATGLIEMNEGCTATTVGDLTERSSELIDGMQVDVLLGIKPGSEAVLRTVAYGNELPKENGEYVKDADDNYLTEEILDDDGPTGKLQYKGGGRYIIQAGEDGTQQVVMLPDPNDPDHKPYPKKTVGDLTAEDANLLDGMSLNSMLGIDEHSSGILKAMKEWTIEDLKDQSKIEGLKIGDILEIETKEDAVKPSDVSNIMWALRTMTVKDLKDQNTINNLKLSDILEIDDSSSGIMKAMKEWTISDLNKQEKIESLKIGEILNGNSSSGLMKALQEWSIADLNQQTRIERLKIGQIITITDGSSKLMQAMKDWRISDLNKQEKIDSLTLADVISIDPESPDTPKMLVALKDMSLGEISSSIDTLTLEDVLGEEAFADNRILSTLRHKQIKELGDAIGNLTLKDVFGDEMLSYAKNYNKDYRPTDIVAADQVESFYYYHDRSTVVTGNWYTGDDESGYKKVADPNTVVAESYIETKVYLTREPSYYEVNYANLEDKSKVYSGGNVEEDDYGFYYLNDAGERVDLEVEYSYKRQDNSGPLPEKTRVHTEKEDGTEKYYYIERTAVTYLYEEASGATHKPDEEELKVGYKEKGTGAEVTAYHAGVWFLLLDQADGKDGATTKITEMAALVTGVTQKINTLTLGEMYIHELIDQNPDTDITMIAQLSGDPELQGKTNLNQLTVNQVIKLVASLASQD